MNGIPRWGTTTDPEGQDRAANRLWWICQSQIANNLLTICHRRSRSPTSLSCQSEVANLDARTLSISLTARPGNPKRQSRPHDSNDLFDRIRLNVAADIANNMSERQMIAYLSSRASRPPPTIAAGPSAPRIEPHVTPKPIRSCDEALRLRKGENDPRIYDLPQFFPPYQGYMTAGQANCNYCGARWAWPTSHSEMLRTLTPEYLFESHLPLGRDCILRLRCLICLEFDKKYHIVTGVDGWLAHMGEHWKDKECFPCTAAWGGPLQRRSDCKFERCPRFHA